MILYVQEFIKNLWDGFLVNMIDEAIDDVWLGTEHIGNEKFLLAIDKNSH